jgi:hypothetical protein
MIEDFPARTAGITAELRIVEIMKSPVPFGDVCGCRPCGAQELISQPIPFLLGQNSNDFFGDEKTKNPAFLPAFQIFERSKGRTRHRRNLSGRRAAKQVRLLTLITNN